MESPGTKHADAARRAFHWAPAAVNALKHIRRRRFPSGSSLDLSQFGPATQRAGLQFVGISTSRLWGCYAERHDWWMKLGLWPESNAMFVAMKSNRREIR